MARYRIVHDDNEYLIAAGSEERAIEMWREISLDEEEACDAPEEPDTICVVIERR